MSATLAAQTRQSLDSRGSRIKVSSAKLQEKLEQAKEALGGLLMRFSGADIWLEHLRPDHVARWAAAD